MRLIEKGRGGAGESGEQSRRGSWSDTPSASKPSLRMMGEASQILIKLNRQIPELETVPSGRKQRTANCSNRQKIQFCSITNSSRGHHASSPIGPSVGDRRLHISNRELLGLEISQLIENKDRQPVLIANFEPSDFFDFQPYVAAAFRRAGFPLSLGTLEPAGMAGKSSQRDGCSK